MPERTFVRDQKSKYPVQSLTTMTIRERQFLDVELQEEISIKQKIKLMRLLRMHYARSISSLKIKPTKNYILMEYCV